MSVTVRDALAEDAAAIARIQVDAWCAAYAGLIDDAFLAAMDVEHRIVTWGETVRTPPRGLALRVAELDDEVIGWSAVSTGHDPDGGELRGYYVHPERWGQGAGRALMHDALRQLRDRGCRIAYLWVLIGNDSAMRVYEQFGWRLTGEEAERESRGIVLRETRMTRSLEERIP
ncbi:MAG TPA: GNAT family N-acetyltransferase [Candidatus Agrococcus pullicola]|uniref:GNAT family N-acetyltransferase n=1 Tax=Candidatus Agrococcus pullicola TaxID=2838429 RepID=A0A9D1YU28_9MICO|nr:GNAT family N-acetyltransferase [Candidatus Agrococcus pullicola]